LSFIGSKNDIYFRSFPSKIVLSTTPKWDFRSAKGTKRVSKEVGNDIAGSGEHRNHLFPDIAHSHFWLCKTEKELNGRSNQVKHLFFDLAQIVFLMVKMIYDKWERKYRLVDINQIRK
jgi:hypothetical protein